MDKERQVRLLYPPFFLIISVLIAFYFDDSICKSAIIQNIGTEVNTFEIIAAFIGGGIAIMILGFVIGTITINVLRLGFLIFQERHYEMLLPIDTIDRIHKKLKLKSKFQKEQGNKKYQIENFKFFSVVTFDHEVIPKGVHKWIVRRWNSFIVSVNSAMAIALSIPIITSCFKIKLTWRWWASMSVIVVLLIFHGIVAYRETMGMLTFQSKCNQKIFKKDCNKK